MQQQQSQPACTVLLPLPDRALQHQLIHVLAIQPAFAAGGEEQMKLAAVTFQNLFPAINVQTTRLSACQVGAAGWAYCRWQHSRGQAGARVTLLCDRCTAKTSRGTASRQHCGRVADVRCALVQP